MKVKLGTLEFEAKPHKLQPGNPGSLFPRPGGPLADLDRDLSDKSLRKLLDYKCATQKEIRYKLEPGDIVNIETDITFYVPRGGPLGQTADPKKSRRFGNAVMKASGLGDMDAFNTAVQGALASYPVKVPIAHFRQRYGKDINYTIFLDVSYQHYLLSLPGKRLSGVIALSFPFDFNFWGFAYKPCKPEKEGEHIERDVYTDTVPLLPDSLTLLAEVKKAHERRKPGLEDQIKREWDLAEYAKKYADDTLKPKPAKPLRSWYDKVRERAKQMERGLKEFEEALDRKQRELAGG